MARALMLAIERAGAEPELTSELQTRDGKGDPDHQADIYRAADEETANVIAAGRAAGWRAWVTYHNYYKAPDLLGPAVSKALGIPYILIEATRARKRLGGPWDGFARAAEAACDAADAICYLTERDALTLRRDAPASQRLIHLRPFLPLETLPPVSTLTGSMLCVAMMRPGDKLASYELVAETLAQLTTENWHLTIAGDGPARDSVVSLMAPFGDRVTFAGALDTAGLDALFGQSSLLYWPGVNEAFGMAYLEAQAAGLPVVAQDRPGVRDVLAPGPYPDPSAGVAPLAAMVDHLLANDAERRRRSSAARTFITKNHLIDSAAQTLAPLLGEAGD
ncbi:glycosyltransferase family 4 protein [Roseobacter sp. S98]|uniref:glycosyltransferase family 4 protein n=1 Tax=Roseobacter algicola (ex Choi et al. 2025) (nom. illeg.) TaxID=3092138 RepID=UPI0035C75174